MRQGPVRAGCRGVSRFRSSARRASGSGRSSTQLRRRRRARRRLGRGDRAPRRRSCARPSTKKGEGVVRANVAAARAGFAPRAARDWGRLHSALLHRERRSYTLISGNEAIPLAAAYAGCRFIAAYPMSPSTEIITTLARDEELGVFAEQAEDEIAAINMAIGASYAGARAMTATSGGGFALMVEASSLAGMTETPLVIVLAQRPGPATGLPTRTEQGDLLFAIHAGHGEFPKLVLGTLRPRGGVREDRARLLPRRPLPDPGPRPDRSVPRRLALLLRSLPRAGCVTRRLLPRRSGRRSRPTAATRSRRAGSLRACTQGRANTSCASTATSTTRRATSPRTSPACARRWWRNDWRRCAG